MTVTDEQWRPALGYEGLYEVSDQGCVRSLDRVVVDSLGRRCSLPGQILRPGRNPRTGRDTVCLYRDRVRSREYVHTLVLTSFVGPRPAGLVACHSNGDRTDNRLSNLRWDTYSENNLDAVRHGTHNHASKVRCIRGHLLQAPNLLDRTDGRACRACQKTYGPASAARRAGIPFDFERAANERYAQIMASA